MSSRHIDTNPYLRNAAVRERSIFRSVATSSAIEGIRAPFKQAKGATSKSKLTTKRAKSAVR